MAGKNSVFINNSAPSVDDTWLNLQQNEGNNIITGSGQSLSDAINNQRVIGVSRFAANNFYIDSGTANAYILTLAASMTNPVSSTVGYFVGMTIRFRAGNANSGASTVNVNSAGVKNLKKEDGTTDLAAGDIPTDIDVMFRYNGTAFCLVRNAATLPEAIAGTNNTKFLTPYLASNLPIVRVAKTTPQNLVNSVWTKITGFSIDLNIGGYWNAGTQKFIPPAGTYQLNLGTNAASNSAYGNAINLYKNGSATIYGLQMSGTANQQNKVSYSEVVKANGTDEFEVYSLMFGTGTLTLEETIFSMYKIR